VSELDEKLRCIFEEVGAQVGEVLRCMIQNEVASHVARIQQLQSVLDGTACQKSGETDAFPPA
jgi:uncharacterized protein YktB (UPF0637 family)